MAGTCFNRRHTITIAFQQGGHDALFLLGSRSMHGEGDELLRRVGVKSADHRVFANLPPVRQQSPWSSRSDHSEACGEVKTAAIIELGEIYTGAQLFVQLVQAFATQVKLFLEDLDQRVSATRASLTQLAKDRSVVANALAVGIKPRADLGQGAVLPIGNVLPADRFGHLPYQLGDALANDRHRKRAAEGRRIVGGLTAEPLGTLLQGFLQALQPL
mmetsp:Transcript_41243/g.132851  ORF Transcript_41243/g.132851 Transcript_41243/m.132851 type:complete len:216 (-) Transcript_41243:1944-2591(-)